MWFFDRDWNAEWSPMGRFPGRRDVTPRIAAIGMTVGRTRSGYFNFIFQACRAGVIDTADL
jgi:hypothetical protein